MTAAEWLARAHTVTDAATKGPWEAVGPYIDAPAFEDGIFAEVNMDQDGSDDERAPIDAAFIAASRTMLPAAVAAIEAVLALHERPVEPYCADSHHDANRCPCADYYCDRDGDPWPCPTVVAIFAALGVTP